MIQTTEAIVLTSKNYSESSKIIHLFSKDFGKFSAIAKGATSPKSKFGKLLQPTNYLLITFYQKAQNQLQLITNAEIVENFWNLHTDIQKSAYSFAIIETIYKLFDDYYENKKVFDLIIDCYKKLNVSDKEPIAIFIYFILKILDYSGYDIDFGSSTGLFINAKYYFDISNGCFSENKISNGIEISNDLLGKIFVIKNKIEDYEKTSIKKKELIQLVNLFQRYIKEHTDKNIFWDSLEIVL